MPLRYGQALLLKEGHVVVGLKVLHERCPRKCSNPLNADEDYNLFSYRIEPKELAKSSSWK